MLSAQANAQLELRRRQRALLGDPLRNPDAVEWIEEHFRIPETSDKRMRLQPYQRAVLRKALTPGADGLLPYSTILWCDIKKSAKSTLTAAVALWRAFQVDWGQVVLVANDLKQADSRVGYYLRRAIELNPVLRGRSRVVRNHVTLDNHTTIEAVPIDPTGEAGGGADMVVFSELWGAHQQAQQRMWTEATLSPLKFGKSFRWVETYAGFSGESPLLEKLYQDGVKDGVLVADIARQFDPELEIFSNDTARLLALWNTHPRNPWQTLAYYNQESSVLTENEFLRVHRNQFVSSLSSFISAAWWDACSESEMPAMDENQPVVIALDAATSGDTFGLVMLSGRRGYRDERWYSDAGIQDVRLVRAWVPPKNGQLDFAPIETEIRDLCGRYNVIELVADPYQLYDMMGRLSADLVANTYLFSQGGDRLVADKSLQDRIRDRRIRHRNEPELRDHLMNANAKADDSKLRIVKKSERLKIDLAVCLSMASDRLEFWNQ